MTADDAVRRVFETLERDGSLAVVLDVVRRRSATAEQKLRLLLRKALITDAATMAEVHALQGRLSAYADVLVIFRALGARPRMPGEPPAPLEALDTGDPSL